MSPLPPSRPPFPPPASSSPVRTAAVLLPLADLRLCPSPATVFRSSALPASLSGKRPFSHSPGPPPLPRGASLQAPRFFDSPAHHQHYYLRFSDAATSSSHMFGVTTVCHRTSDCKHPLVMLTNREGSRYFFGKIPEGAQRVLNENGIKLGKLRSIFLTGTVLAWADIGGLPGLFLTISDATSRGIDVFTNSSRVMAYIVATWRYFVFRKGIALNVLDTDPHSFIGDSSAVFRPVKIASDVPAHLSSSALVAALRKLTSLMFPQDTSTANSRDPDSYKSDPSENEIQTHVRLPDPARFVDVHAQPALSFVVRFLPVRGKFDPVKAKALGVAPGVNYRKLTMGESVQNAAGETVLPHQVLDESKSFAKLVIIDIPNAHYLHNTLSSPEWLATSTAAGPEEPGLVYHFLGDDIDFRLDQYRTFIALFPPQCQHVISHSLIANDTLVFKTYAVHLLKLKCILNDSFTLPRIEQYTPLDDAPNIHKLQALQQFTIDPSGVTRDDSNIVSETWSSLYDAEVPQVDVLAGTDKSAVLANEIITLLPLANATSLKDHVQVVTLGTGSALPSIHRNVLSNLVRIPYLDQDSNDIRFKSILLDGGENTIGSIIRNYAHNNLQQLSQIFSELRLIYLSHLHADHHLGIISVITAWFDANKHNTDKLYLVIPWQYNNFVTEWYKLEQYTAQIDLDRIVYLSCEEFMRSPEPQLRQYSLEEFEEKFDTNRLNDHIPKESGFVPLTAKIDMLYRDLNLASIRTVRAIHCYWSYSVSLTFNLSQSETFKVSFSGDTRPSTRFIDSGFGSDLLIHEASLDNELIEEAIAKKHSTVVEAVRVSQLMNCRKVILTHFSARFSEKHNFIQDASQYQELSNNLKSYIGRSTTNVFNMDARNELRFEDIEICYANDMMTIRYNALNCQKPFFKKLNELSNNDITEAEVLKNQKEMLKKSEKREAKRLQRLAGKRKRRPSAASIESV